MDEPPITIEEDAPSAPEKLADLIDSADAAEVTRFLSDLPEDEWNRTVCRLDSSRQVQMFSLLSRDVAAGLLNYLPGVESSTILAGLDAVDAAGILSELPANQSADLVGRLSDLKAEAIFSEMPDRESSEVRELASYDSQSAGGLMATEVIGFPKDITVAETLRRVADRETWGGGEDVQYFYVTDGWGRLKGVVPLRTLITSSRKRLLSKIMISSPVCVSGDDTLEHLLPLFENHSYLGLPVIDGNGRLIGILSRSAVEQAKARRARTAFMRLSGIVGGEELRDLPLSTRALRRLAFLAPNIVLNLVAASVIALYQDTLEAVIALAVFLPIVSDMSGCSGNQAVAVSIRELALGLIRPREVGRIFAKEGLLGMINGTVLGLLLGTVAAVWQGNIWIGLVVGGALAANTLVSVLLGGLIPLVLKGAKVDPALASGPVLTTVTDMCGFFLVLSFASTMLHRLVPNI